MLPSAFQASGKQTESMVTVTTKIDSVDQAGQSSLAFVGQQGLGADLDIDERSDHIRVQWARRGYALTLSMLALLGPGLCAMFFIRPQAVHLPSVGYFSYALPAMAIVLSILFVTRLRAFLFRRRALDICASGITLLEGRQTVRTIDRSALQSLTIDTSQYLLSASQSIRHQLVPNYILSAQLKTGSTEALCISSNQSQIEQLRASIVHLLHLP